MKRVIWMIRTGFIAGFMLLAGNFAEARIQPKVLWQIGQADHSTKEFALAPSGYRNFGNDGFFIIGTSDPARDWPYVQPGPGDSWAGSRRHTFSIAFGMKDAGHDGTCSLVIDLADTQNTIPPRLDIQINDSTYRASTPAGNGDASIDGKPSAGKPYQIRIGFPASIIRKGSNTINIRSVSGSWMLYDALHLEGPDYLEPEKSTSLLAITGIQPAQGVYEKENKLYRDIEVSVQYAGGAFVGELAASGRVQPVKIRPGGQTIVFSIPEVDQPTRLSLQLKRDGKELASGETTISPVRKMTIYILPHSHTDIGYTEIQTAIEKKQVNNLVEGIKYAKQTAGYPVGARFVWNVEVTWAADLYMNRLDEQARKDLIEAARNGQVSFNGMYLNELTGLCRPEELLRLFKYSSELTRLTGQKIDAAMISDVPGYTWGTVTAMAEAGIRYFSVAPNYFDRIGDILQKWENKPFWWLSPSGKEKVLVWIPLKGYALSHMIGKLTPAWASDYLGQLDQMNYPYDIAHIRWSGHGDNAVPDPAICEFVKDWNTKYAWPKFIISSTSEAFGAFEKKYGDQIPSFSGDWTPYWEDGAGSSALETGMNRNTADRLSQAEVLYALRDPSHYPVDRFEEAWKKVLLYSEHTWGAWCSISDPENKMTIEQWDIKKGYADDAAKQTDVLMEAIQTGPAVSGIQVTNTNSWERTEMVFIPADLSKVGDRVTDATGNVLESQRLKSGELAVAGVKVPPFSTVNLKVMTGKVKPRGSVVVKGNVISNNRISCTVDPQTGDIVSLIDLATGKNLIDTGKGRAANQYLYLEGKDLANLKTSGGATLTITESGPVLGCIEVSSTAPGCNRLVRDIWLADSAGYLVISNTVDKKRIAMPEKIGDGFSAQNLNKESVNFAFPFAVPGGTMRMDLPIGQIIPWKDQLPSACKNWFTTGRWVDVSNDNEGVTWVTLDAPLVEVGEISATLIGSQSNPEVWRKTVEPTQTFYSWAMNNHWGTNYRQHQEGPVMFRYILRPHRAFDAAESTRFATGFTQPLLVHPALKDPGRTPFTLNSQSVVAIAFKPADDGDGFVLTLYNPGKTADTFVLKPVSGGPVYRCDTGENKLGEVGGRVELAGEDVLMVRFR